MKHAFDAGPLMAFLKGERCDAVVTPLLLDNPGECFAHAVNLAEVYYLFCRQGGASTAEAAIKKLLEAGVIPSEQTHAASWKEAASFKGRHPLALPDGFCFALARRIGGTVVTTDHAEFEILVPLGYYPILFIR